MKTSNTHTSHKDGIIRVLLGTALILAVPLTAMAFSDEVNWGLFDFIVIGTLLLGSGLAYELIVKRVGDSTRRAAITIVLLAALLLVWVELAVGIFGSPIAGS